MSNSPEINLSPRVMYWIAHLDRAIYNIDLITNACVFASLHENKSTPFLKSTLSQGLAMADVLIALQCDSAAIAAAILYPTIFYQKELSEKLHKSFDPTICKLILGAIQIDTIHHAPGEKNKITGQQNQVENLRKMLLAMVDDIRTILLKLAERLIMLQHLQNCDPKTQQQIAQDTMDYYAPLANRLGIGHIKWQLEDWGFRYLHPAEYQQISTALHMRHEDRVRGVHKMIAELKILLDKNNLKNAKISGRIKHIYSIYRKTQRKKLPVEQIYDVSAVRILLPTVHDCYTALSIVHHEWKPITTEFDDYIAKPKQNGYQSIHTAVLRKESPIEIQIRTVDMHNQAELGIAAHWKYKENKATTDNDEQKINLLRELLDWQHTISTEETQKKLYRAAFHDRVYVFSPNGDVFDLKSGATPLDFAYLIHTNIGHRCRGAKVNGALVPLTHTLQTGDRISILTTKEGHPSRDWLRPDLGYLKTMHAIRKVRAWFYKQDYETIPSDETATAVEKTHSDTIVVPEKPLKKITPSSTDFSVQGATHLLTQLAQCCHPIPGDHIIGYITQGRGITVHQKNCHNIRLSLANKPERIIDITWENQAQKNYRVTLEIQGEDRAGLLRDVTAVIAQLNLSILSITSRIDASYHFAIMELTIEVNNLELLEDIQKKIRQIHGVTRVKRR